MRLHDYPSSGNCHKVRLALAQLAIPYERVAVDIFDGGTLTDDFGRLNPARTTPVLETDDGDVLVESNAILVYLAEGSELLPDNRVERAHVLRWLFYEQAEIVPSIGGLRVRFATGCSNPAAAARRAARRPEAPRSR
jgi:glutathione S-transferase